MTPMECLNSPGDNDIKGDVIIKYVDAPYGRIGSVIC